MAETSDMVIKIKEKCQAKKKPDDKAKKQMDLSSGKQFYVFKVTKKDGKTWYKISEIYVGVSRIAELV